MSASNTGSQRQRKWREAQKAKNLCVACGKEHFSGAFRCEECTEDVRLNYQPGARAIIKRAGQMED